jgi:NADPH:quinone reductase-like Zn-dependent oxidoreductase
MIQLGNFCCDREKADYLNEYFFRLKSFNMAESTTTKTKGDIPFVMLAAQQNGYGDARDVLTLSQNVPVPRQLSSNQILVRVHAASINPIDWKVLNGNMSLVKKLSFPHIPGNDVAGVVVDVGSSVQRLQVGDKVYGNLGGDGGTYAEYVRGNESHFALKPNNLSMVEAAAVPLACEVSYQALFKKTSPPIGSESKVFVCGGSSATGSYAIQLAKAVGAHVTTTCSQRNFSFMERLGEYFSPLFLSVTSHLVNSRL